MYFDNCTTVGDVKSRYRFLAMQNHPDHGGDTRTMQDINAAYHKILERLDGQVYMGDDAKEHTYRYSYQTEAAILNKVKEALDLHMDGVTIEIVGYWVWAYGNTWNNKEQLKSIKFIFHDKRKMWYWRQYGRSTYRGTDFNHLRMMYGSHVVEDEDVKHPEMIGVPV